MGTLQAFRSWNRVRIAVNRVLRDNDPSALEGTLREFPVDARHVARRARIMADVFPFHAVLLAVTLAGCGSRYSPQLLRQLATREFGWDGLDARALGICATTSTSSAMATCWTPSADG